MQDARLRILSIFVLSIGAFLSLPGAVAVIIWWLLLTPRFRGIARLMPLLAMLVMIAIAALMSELTGGAGLSYLIRMTAIVLVAVWAYAQRREGELLDVSVWMLGDGIGFDVGLAAEMGMQGLELAVRDARQAQMAMKSKGMRLAVAPLAAGVLTSQLRRADESAQLLRARGYRGGGLMEPCLPRGRGDIALALTALIPLLLSLFWHIWA